MNKKSDTISPELQQNWTEALRRAQSGDAKFTWLRKLVIDAGFAPVHGREAGSLLLVTPKSLADGFRVTERTIRSWIKEGLPVHQYSVGNRPALYDVFDVVRWREKRYEATGESDPLMRGGSSPALERYRAAKAIQAERENKKAEKALAEVATVSAQLSEIGRSFKVGAEIIARLHGTKVGAAIRELVDKAQGDWERLGLKKRKKGK
jgi:phage terminase Nu1 subunit (DNA packaging protein)